MNTITKQFAFEAAHRLYGLPAGHKCGNPHGHSYRVEVVLQSEALNEHGFVRDYGDLNEFGDYIKQNFDHHDLNQVVPFPTTSENLCFYLFCVAHMMAPETVAVRLSETQKTWCEYRPPTLQPYDAHSAEIWTRIADVQSQPLHTAPTHYPPCEPPKQNLLNGN
jgi:6-pyruvoyltetrahydropterin/6-carboxytetrahydropterin synthase